MDYNKYLKLYKMREEGEQKRIGRGGGGKSKSEQRKSDFLVFQSKWAEYLIEEADYDLKPIISLDPDRNLFKPTNLH